MPITKLNSASTSHTDTELTAQEQEQATLDAFNASQAEQANASSYSNAAAGLGVVAGVGALATVAANTTVNVDANALSTETHLGPLSGSQYAGVSQGDAVHGKSSNINLGFASASHSEQHSTGKHGLSSTESNGWNIGGIGCKNTTHSGIGEKGHVFDYKTEGNFFGQKYKGGFNIPAPDLAKTGHQIGNFFKQTGPAILSAANHVGPAINHAAHAVAKMGPPLAKGVGSAAHVVGEVAKAFKK